MAKKILVLNGHPGVTSLSRLLTESYADAARVAGHAVRMRHLHELAFDMDFGVGGYEHVKPLEPELEQFVSDIDWADHLVIAAPLWWGGLPAKLKGLIDRIFLPGKAFDTRHTTWLGMPRPMLVGRSARVILTADTPGFLERLMYGNAILRQLRGQILGFVGFEPVRFTWLSGASHPRDGVVERWQKKVRRLGAIAA